jgi:ADP-ribose pyrophosphatase YjhB (NUDIX family)
MNSAARPINPHISVDCVIFGFSTSQLKVLLIERQHTNEEGVESLDYKLPGDFISIDEDLDMAATRTLEELTGLRNIFLQQFAVFSHPDRVSSSADFNWFYKTTGHEIQRVVTSAYFALINISDSKAEYAIKNNASWMDLNQLPPLAFDHHEIITKGLEHLRKNLRNEPIGFELLPEKFTLRELQSLYEAILRCKLDNRNFRKKILKAGYLVQMEERQEGVAHKPAFYYRFDRKEYESSRKDDLGFNF